jgi:hypothetical protein
MKSVRRVLIAAATAATAASAVLATAGAASAAPAGFSPVISCASVAGSTSYTPGLLAAKTRATTAVLAGTVTGCQDNLAGGPLAGTGSLNATLSGVSRFGAVNETGSFVISWPSFYNPSTGALRLSGPNADGSYTVSGQVTGGAFVGALVSTQLFITGTNKGATGAARHALTRQSWVDSAPLVISRNLG